VRKFIKYLWGNNNAILMVEMAQMAVPGGKGKATGAKEVWVGNPRKTPVALSDFTIGWKSANASCP
jgi:hypothetical protein